MVGVPTSPKSRAASACAKLRSGSISCGHDPRNHVGKNPVVPNNGHLCTRALCLEHSLALAYSVRSPPCGSMRQQVAAQLGKVGRLLLAKADNPYLHNGARGGSGCAGRGGSPWAFVGPGLDEAKSTESTGKARGTGKVAALLSF